MKRDCHLKIIRINQEIECLQKYNDLCFGGKRNSKGERINATIDWLREEKDKLFFKNKLESLLENDTKKVLH